MIVDDDRDREKWFEPLDRVTRRFGWRFFAWVLVDNHFHRFLQTPDANLSAGNARPELGIRHLFQSASPMSVGA